MVEKVKKLNSEKTKKEGNEKSQESFSGGFFEFLRSMRLAIYLFILLAFLSIFGTIIQQEGTESNQKIVINLGFATTNFLKFFRLIDEPRSMEEIISRGESIYRFLSAIGIMNMYHSWWFVTLLLLLTVNLFLCSIKRLPAVLKYFSEPKIIYEEGLNGESKLKIKGSPEETKKKILEIIGKKFSRCSEKDVDGASHFLFEKGRFGRLGVIVTHFSIFFIFIGSLVGSIWGFKGFLYLVEGEQSDTYWDKGKNAEAPLGFTLKCEKAYVTYYKGEGKRPKGWFSDLSVIKDNKKAASKVIRVNDPLSYNGLYFYQANFGEGGVSKISIEVTPRAGGEKKLFNVGMGKEFNPGMGIRVKVAKFIPDFIINGKEIVSRSDELNNPAALLDIEENGKTFSTWIFMKYPDFHPFKETPFIFKLINIVGKNKTGLEVVYDPGVILIWIGCVLLVTGLYISFFVPHKRIWVKLDKSFAAITGSTSKNKPSFELEMEGLVSNLKGALK